MNQTPNPTPWEYQPFNPAPTPAPRKKWPTWALIAIPVGVLVLLLCGICGTCAAITYVMPTPTTSTAANAPTSTTGSSHVVGFPTAAPQATATPIPPTATPDTRAANYRAYVVAQTATLKSDFTNAGNHCGTGHTLGECRAVMVTAHNAVVAFQKGLATHPAPPCLTSADTSLRAALTDYANGTQLAINGIDDLDADEITSASGIINDGNDEMNAAATAVSSATCP